MAHRHWWIFGEPKEREGELLVDFYYQIGKHTQISLPLPAQRFAAAGELLIHIPHSASDSKSPISGNRIEAGKQLYQFLGGEAQTTLIRSFANLPSDGDDRVLYLLFPSPTSENREWCLALEDLPWELLHDGEAFITQRYSLQIIRSHAREQASYTFRNIAIPYWRALLVTPFASFPPNKLQDMGLEPLPNAVHEMETLRLLEKQTHGLFKIEPSGNHRKPYGIGQVSKLERLLLSEDFSIVHYVGHGVIYQNEPCLCFEDGDQAIDYVPVSRLRRILQNCIEHRGVNSAPNILFLNACSSSSRGRYSAGFASGLYDLGISVIGYQTEIRDDGQPAIAAESFYRSICQEQPLKQPQKPATVAAAVADARRQLRSDENDRHAAWGNLRVYQPSEDSFRVLGRGWLERTVQGIYRHYAQWMNPADYTDHVSIGFILAIVFGSLMGIQNLMFIFTETVLSNYLTYNEIVSELLRIFLVGPLSFLAAAVAVAFITKSNHRLLLKPLPIHAVQLTKHVLQLSPAFICAGVFFSCLFAYSFSRLDVLTTRTQDLATLISLPVSQFWYGLVAALGIAIAFFTFIATVACFRRKETLHSYRTFYFIITAYSLIAVLYSTVVSIRKIPSAWLIGLWFLCVSINIAAYSFATIKIIKETAWRSSQNRNLTATLSWKKLTPLLGGAVLALFCYFLLEESVRFETETIRWALSQRSHEKDIDAQDPYVEHILERALRQRAVTDVPDSIIQNSNNDWLLSVIKADALLYRSMQYDDPIQTDRALARCLEALKTSTQLNPEVEYQDYYCNIFAIATLSTSSSYTGQKIPKDVLEDALAKANIAVRNDSQNFAYLDTLARVEYCLGMQTGEHKYFEQAWQHILEAEWSAFFLRSSRAAEVRQSIENIKQKISAQISPSNAS